MVMGSANTSEDIMKIYRQLNLNQCSVHLIDVPKRLISYKFADIFEVCVKDYNMIPIAVYKKANDDFINGTQGILNS